MDVEDESKYEDAASDTFALDGDDGQSQAGARSAQVAERVASGAAASASSNEPFPLHHAAWMDDADRITVLMAEMQLTKQQMKELFDDVGNTPLHVAAIRGSAKAAKALLDSGFPAEVKSTRGWIALLEAGEARHKEIALMIAKAEMDQVQNGMTDKKQALLARLRALPDLTMSIRWDVASSLPGLSALLRKYAPHDTYTLWKRGSRLRVDGSLMGIRDDSASLVPEWKRGHFSLLYDASEGSKGKAIFVNHSAKKYIDVKTARKKMGAASRGMSEAEVKKMEEAALAVEVDELVRGRFIENTKVKASEFRFKPVAGWLTKEVKEKVEGWNCKVYEASGKMIATSRFKEPWPASLRAPSPATYRDYLAAGALLGPDVVLERALNPLNPASFKKDKGKKGGAAGGEEGDEFDDEGDDGEGLDGEEMGVEDVSTEVLEREAAAAVAAEEERGREEEAKRRGGVEGVRVSVSASGVEGGSGGDVGEGSGRGSRQPLRREARSGGAAAAAAGEETEQPQGGGVAGSGAAAGAAGEGQGEGEGEEPMADAANGVHSNASASSPRHRRHGRAAHADHSHKPRPPAAEAAAGAGAKFGPPGSASKKARKVTGRCWMAADFPLSLHQLLPLLEVVGTANKVIARVSKFMTKYGDLAMFPVKVQVPLMLTVYVELGFKAFQLLPSAPGQSLKPQAAAPGKTTSSSSWGIGSSAKASAAAAASPQPIATAADPDACLRDEFYLVPADYTLSEVAEAEMMGEGDGGIPGLHTPPEESEHAHTGLRHRGAPGGGDTAAGGLSHAHADRHAGRRAAGHSSVLHRNRDDDDDDVGGL